MIPGGLVVNVVWWLSSAAVIVAFVVWRNR